METEKRANLFSIGAKSKAMQLSNIVSFSGQEMFSEINFSLFLPLQNSNVVYLETFCANTVSETGWRTAASCCIFSKQRKPLFVYYLPSPLHCRPNRWLHYYIVLWIAGNCIMVEVPATKTRCNIFQYVVACGVVTVQCRVWVQTKVKGCLQWGMLQMLQILSIYNLMQREQILLSSWIREGFEIFSCPSEKRGWPRH